MAECGMQGYTPASRGTLEAQGVRDKKAKNALSAYPLEPASV